jgi:hypothetical protein
MIQVGVFVAHFLRPITPDIGHFKIHQDAQILKTQVANNMYFDIVPGQATPTRTT